MPPFTKYNVHPSLKLGIKSRRKRAWFFESWMIHIPATLRLERRLAGRRDAGGVSGASLRLSLCWTHSFYCSYSVDLKYSQREDNKMGHSANAIFLAVLSLYARGNVEVRLWRKYVFFYTLSLFYFILSTRMTAVLKLFYSS